MKKSILRLIFLCMIVLQQLFAAAQDPSHLRISLLTCTPGEELYSTFGHTAIRVIDSTSTITQNGVTTIQDLVFNYGTFNFEEPGFYVKFVRGKLLYSLSIDTFNDFIFEYQMSNRGITEQVLNLSQEEKIAVQKALRENYKTENRFYKYDFFLDNCTTRARDIIIKNKLVSPSLPPVMPASFRFRQAIHQYLDHNKKYWSKLGIDILLGAPCDAVMTTAQQEFLPDNLMIAFDSTKNVSMVQSSHNLYQTTPRTETTGWFTPMICFVFILLLYILLSLASGKIMRTILFVLDRFLFLVTGLLGILLLFMWFGTDHSMTKDNYNLLWAWPTHAIAAFFSGSNKKWVKTYFRINQIALVILLLLWFFLPQQMNNALLPVAGLLLLRAFAAGRKMSSPY